MHEQEMSTEAVNIGHTEIGAQAVLCRVGFILCMTFLL